MSLLISTVLSGSRNRLAPLDELPCTMPGMRRPVLGADQQDVAAVAVGDDLFLQVLGRVARPQVALERAPQPRPLLPQPVADRAERRAGVVEHVARSGRWPAGRPRFPARRTRSRADERQQSRVGRPGLAPDGVGALVHGFEERGQAEQPQRFEGPALDIAAPRVSTMSAGARSGNPGVSVRNRTASRREFEARRHGAPARRGDERRRAARRPGASARGCAGRRRRDRTRAPSGLPVACDRRQAGDAELPGFRDRRLWNLVS